MCIKNAVSKNTTEQRIMFIWNRTGDLQHVDLYTCGRAEKGLRKDWDGGDDRDRPEITGGYDETPLIFPGNGSIIWLAITNQYRRRSPRGGGHIRKAGKNNEQNNYGYRRHDVRDVRGPHL